MEMTVETSVELKRPWLKLHPRREDSAPFCGRFKDGLSMFRHAVSVAGDGPAIHYFDRTLSYTEIDRLSDLFAGFLLERGIREGDRVALYLQNVPQFLICLIGIWKLGGIGVSINPMNRARELTLLLEDSGAQVLVTHRDLYQDVASQVLQDFPGVLAITTSTRDFQSRNDVRVMSADEIPHPSGALDLMSILQGPARPHSFRAELPPASPAMLVYTSGTTGIPKGAVITHANFAFDSDLWREWNGLRDGGPILAVAPLFHITGLVGHLGAAIATCSPLILSMRFHPAVTAEAAEEYRAEFVVGAITAFIAMMNSPDVRREQLSTLKHVVSGGAPVPAKVAEDFKKRFGHSVKNGYGMTETSSMTIAVPPSMETPTDANGAFSIGVPAFSTDAYIADEDGKALPPGEVGELFMRGPQVISEYWQRPDATREAFFNGFLRSGDVAYMSEDGWFFLVDRKKDMISASGYKVWPKEVEDVIYTHPAIREAAVVGVKDEYRGETVKAVVSLKPGMALEPAELIAFCKERMAAYKSPRLVVIIDELPKTRTGKILGRELR